MEPGKPKRRYYIKSEGEKTSDRVRHIQIDLLREYRKLEKSKDSSPAVIAEKIKLAGAISYGAQVQGTLMKTVDFDRRIRDLEKAAKIKAMKKLPEWGK